MLRLFKSRTEKMIDAWRKAEKELGIQIQAPFILEEHTTKVLAQLLVKDFGSKKGTVILTTDDMTHFNTPEKYGYYCSALNPNSYKKYDRVNFIETLTDWGYYGDKGKKPDWLVENIWSNK